MLKKNRRDFSVSNFLKTLKNIEIPKKGENIFFVQYDGYTQLDFVLKISSEETILDLKIISFRLNLKSIYLLEDAQKRGMINNINYYLSDSIPQMVKSTYNYLIKKNVIYDNFHSKMCLIKTKKNNYTIQSTGNFHFEKDIEATTIHNDKKLFLKMEKWINKF